MKTIRGKSMMRNILIAVSLSMILIALAACGGGGGTTQVPAATVYTLAYSAAANGSLSGSASQTVKSGDTASAVTAVPDAGYHFINWTEGGAVVSVSPVLTASDVAASHNFTANFAIDTQSKSIATLKINLTGTLSPNTAIAGADITLVLPVNVTPALAGTAVAPGVVSLSGTFAGGAQTDPVYSEASGNNPGKLHFTLVNAAPAGVTQVDEVATITLQLANGATPTITDFSFSSVSVIDAAFYSQIDGMWARVASVTLQ